MRIGTWNLEGHWSPRHQEFLGSLECDLLLLTEVPHVAELPGFTSHASRGTMAHDRRWSAVLAPRLAPLPDPHPATAAARVNGLTVCCSVLPWRGAGGGEPWTGADTGARTTHAVEAVVGARPDIWGGDWNTALSGTDHAGTREGRRAIGRSLESLGLTVPTSQLPHRLDCHTSIDHVAVPTVWRVLNSTRVPARTARGFLSDHDAYIVEATPPARELSLVPK